MKKELDIFHFIPLYDLREHEITYTCWCHPVEDEYDPGCWKHNALDRRELYLVGEIKIQ